MDKQRLIENIKSEINITERQKSDTKTHRKQLFDGALSALRSLLFRIESGAFDTPEPAYPTLDAYESACRALWKHRDEAERLREAFKELPDKIVDIQRFADMEELTFPMENPTEEEQNEWLERFVVALGEHVHGVIEESLDAITTVTNGGDREDK